MHPIQRRFLAEDLVRLRRAGEERRFAMSQRRGRIDPNPHQVDAVIFALRRVREGGCILADEVGLGKTIEAGLVIAQLMAEGMRRVLVIAPKPLLGQWHQELYSLFGIEAMEGGASVESLAGSGVFLIGREAAGGDRGAQALTDAEPFDLAVIDEAHELFAGIWQRFDRDGRYKESSSHSQIAARVRAALAGVPVLLLTATPIQNSLAELWGLVHYVEPTGTLLGDLPTFRSVFCEGDDRRLVPGQEDELRRRLESVQKRTLRRQAKEFLETPFVDRHARCFTYRMSPEERALLDEVSAYLLEPNLCAFTGKQRQLLLISFHRQMASSRAALAASLGKVALRLEGMLRGENVWTEDTDLEDLEDSDLERSVDEVVTSDIVPISPARIRDELIRVRGYIERAEAMTHDSKAEKFLEVVRSVRARSETSGRLVVFTASLTTQDYLRKILIDGGIPDESITLFRGDNESLRTNQALERWVQEVESLQPAQSRPKNKKVRQRLALVHEFSTRSSIFISTEAGAKGLNLQFCESLINYDLPWNPQKIEQRIGRCHRYGQKNAVTVINFLAEDNDTEKLLFEILAMKLDLFGQVLDASDVIIHSPGTDAPETLTSTVGTEIERELGRIYQRCRNISEVKRELESLRSAVEENRRRFEQTQAQTESLIKSRLDADLRQVFKGIRERLPASLAELDRDLERLVCGYLEASHARFSLTRTSQATIIELEEASGSKVRYLIGQPGDRKDVSTLNLGHPLVTAAVQEARAGPTEFRVRIAPSAEFAEYVGRRGRMALSKVRYEGFEPIERLLVSIVFEGQTEPLPDDEARRLLDRPMTDSVVSSTVDQETLEDAIEVSSFFDQAGVADAEQARFDRAIEQLERYLDDRLMVARRQRDELRRKLKSADARRDAALGPEQRAKAQVELIQLTDELELVEQRIAKLQAGEDEVYRRGHARATERRFAPPRVERLLEAELEIV